MPGCRLECGAVDMDADAEVVRNPRLPALLQLVALGMEWLLLYHKLAIDLQP